jgi:hypothetical protein
MFNSKPSPKTTFNFAPPRFLKFLPVWVAWLLSLSTSFAQISQTWCTLTATHSVGNSSTTQLSTWFPSTSSATGEVIVIGIDATLKIDKSFNFTNSFFRCSKGAKIEIVGTGVKFGALGTKFFSCADMWEGISVMPGTLIDFNNSGFYNANAAITFVQGYAGSQNILRRNRFDNDLIGIVVGSTLGGTATTTVAFTWCWGNEFLETGAGLNDPVFQHVGAGIQVNTRGNLTFGTPQGLKNNFENIRLGIKLNSGSATVQHCRFKNMYTPGLSAQYNEGTGISANKSSLTVSGSGAFNCVFDNCSNYGVYSSIAAGRVLVENASFTGKQKYCFFYQLPVGGFPVIFRNNDCRLNQYDCISAVYCERPSGTLNTPNSQINNNHIAIPNQNFTKACDWVAMIDVRSTQGGDNTFEISYNYLENFTKCGKVHGIYVQGSGNNYKVNYNRVEYLANEALLTINELGSYGIAFENMTGAGNEIEQDTVISRVVVKSTNVETPDKSFIKCGIHVFNAGNPTVCQNYVNNTYRGFHLSESNIGMIFGLNSMNRHVFGLHCSKGSNSGLPTDISTQVRRENTWSTSSGDYISGGVGAKYADLSIPPFIFYYDATKIPLGHIPPNATPTLGVWFKDLGGIANQCGSGLKKFEDSEIAISKNLYPTTTASASWDLQRLLWGKIVREPGVQNLDPDVLAFYNTGLGSSPHQYASAFSQFEQAFIPNATLGSQINNALDLIILKEAEVDAIQTIIAQDSMTIAPADAAAYETAVGQLAVLRQNLSDLVDTYITDRDSKLATLSTAAGSLPNTDPWEKAWSNMLDAAIKTGKGEELGTTERNALIGIANICASDIGMAAQAVTTVMSAVDAYPYMGRESSDGCTSVVRSTEYGSSLPQNKNIILFPNPATDRLYITFPSSVEGHYFVYNTAGILLTEGAIQAGQSLLDIDLMQFVTGLYLFRIEAPDQNVIQQVKFTVSQ